MNHGVHGGTEKRGAGVLTLLISSARKVARIRHRAAHRIGMSTMGPWIGRPVSNSRNTGHREGSGEDMGWGMALSLRASVNSVVVFHCPQGRAALSRPTWQASGFAGGA